MPPRRTADSEGEYLRGKVILEVIIIEICVSKYLGLFMIFAHGHRAVKLFIYLFIVGIWHLHMKSLYEKYNFNADIIFTGFWIYCCYIIIAKLKTQNILHGFNQVYHLGFNRVFKILT